MISKSKYPVSLESYIYILLDTNNYLALTDKLIL